MLNIQIFITSSNRMIFHKRQLSLKSVMTAYSSLLKPKPLKPPFNHLTQIGDPCLRSISKPVPYEDIHTENIQRLIVHLKHTFKKNKCIGLSATQVGVPLRIFLMGVNDEIMKQFSLQEQKNKEIVLINPTVVINPEIEIVDFKKIVSDESCGSIKGFCADVPRHYSLKLQGFNDYAEEIEISASGFTARIIQHEMDHLNGILYTDIMDRKSLTCSCWEVVNQRNGKVHLPYGPL